MPSPTKPIKEHHMDSQNLPCPKCPKILHSDSELAGHLRQVHGLSESEIRNMRGRGYFEAKTATVNGDIALQHQKDAILAQMRKEPPLNVPMVFKEEQRHANPPAGWQKTLEGFIYEKLISQQHTIDSIIKKVLKGSLISNHGLLSLYVYTKDVGELSELQDKKRILESTLTGYITIDPEYHVVSQKIWETHEKIENLKKDLGTDDTETDTLLEEWYSGDLNTNEHVEWEEGFMQKALLEAEQIIKTAPKQEIKL